MLRFIITIAVEDVSNWLTKLLKNLVACHAVIQKELILYFASYQTKTAFEITFPIFDQHLSQGAILTFYQIRNCVQEFAETGVEIESNYLRPFLMNKYGIQDEAEMFHEREIGNQTLVIPPNQGPARIICFSRSIKFLSVCRRRSR